MKMVRQLTFLLADDNPVYRQALRRMVEAHSDWSVIAEAADGAEALQLTAQLTPDVVLIDINMPIMNGIEGGATSQESLAEQPCHYIQRLPRSRIPGCQSAGRGRLLFTKGGPG
jgi:DNA-binding NarL/FixJ family response regulator